MAISMAAQQSEVFGVGFFEFGWVLVFFPPKTSIFPVLLPMCLIQHILQMQTGNQKLPDARVWRPAAQIPALRSRFLGTSS